MAGYTSTDRYVISNDKTIAERKSEETLRYSVYMARDGDSFEKLAAMYLGNSRLYWQIADINPQVEWPDNIEAGTSIRLPI